MKLINEIENHLNEKRIKKGSMEKNSRLTGKAIKLSADLLKSFEHLLTNPNVSWDIS